MRDLSLNSDSIKLEMLKAFELRNLVCVKVYESSTAQQIKIQKFLLFTQSMFTGKNICDVLSVCLKHCLNIHLLHFVIFTYRIIFVLGVFITSICNAFF